MRIVWGLPESKEGRELGAFGLMGMGGPGRGPCASIGRSVVFLFTHLPC